MKKYYPNILLVAGSGRNVGKTSLICSIINKVQKTDAIIAIKITNHFHSSSKIQGSEFILFQSSEYIIYKEETKSEKDSGRFLEAGAKQVLYIETEQHCTKEAFLHALQYIPKEQAIICESGSLIDTILPAAFIMVIGNTVKNKTESDQRLVLADLVFDSSNENYIFDISNIQYNNDSWKIQKETEIIIK
jgi:hypothetical protein